MSSTVDLKISPPVEAACKRMTYLLESGYLSDRIKTDLVLLIHGAMAWELSQKMNEPKDNSQETRPDSGRREGWHGPSQQTHPIKPVSTGNLRHPREEDDENNSEGA
jgi:hypothetical protein